mgnify:CR=1 FL=1
MSTNQKIRSHLVNHLFPSLHNGWLIPILLCSTVLIGCIVWDSDFTFHPREVKSSHWQLDVTLVAATKYIWNDPQGIIDSEGEWRFSIGCKIPKREDCQSYLYIDSLTIRSGDTTLLSMGDSAIIDRNPRYWSIRAEPYVKGGRGLELYLGDHNRFKHITLSMNVSTYDCNDSLLLFTPVLIEGEPGRDYRIMGENY